MHTCKHFHLFPDYVVRKLFSPIEYERLQIWSRNKHQVFVFSVCLVFAFVFSLHAGLNFSRVFSALPLLTLGGK